MTPPRLLYYMAFLLMTPIIVHAQTETNNSGSMTSSILSNLTQTIENQIQSQTIPAAQSVLCPLNSPSKYGQFLQKGSCWIYDKLNLLVPFLGFWLFILLLLVLAWFLQESQPAISIVIGLFIIGLLYFYFTGV